MMIDCSRVKNYFSEKRRMIRKHGYVCKLNCAADCPLNWSKNGTDVSCEKLEMLYPEQAISIVQKWSDENPQKTFLTELLNIFPNTLLADNGMPKHLCPYHLGLMNRDDCRKYHDCAECWNQPMP